MGTPSQPAPALQIVAVFSRYDAALEWAQVKLAEKYGEIALLSAAFDFAETTYYTASMGPGLKKQFLAFEQLIDPATLPVIKRATNDLELAYKDASAWPEARPLNLDPGYIDLGKLVLASTKDHAHRLYLGAGIYGEVTLYYKQKAWDVWPWTYPDYRRADFQAFFSACRQYLRERLRGPAA